MVFELLKALFVGMVVAAPIGPVLLVVIQKTLCYGRKYGMLSGTGSMIADNLYAAGGIFALAVIRDFVDCHKSLIMIAGGILVCVVGVLMLRRRQVGEAAEDKGCNPVACIFQTMGCAFSNPSAFAFMLAMLALCRMDSERLSSPVWLVLIFIAAGELLYWMFVTFALKRFLKVSDSVLLGICRGGGAVMLVFGAILLVKGLMIICNG